MAWSKITVLLGVILSWLIAFPCYVNDYLYDRLYKSLFDDLEKQVL